MKELKIEHIGGYRVIPKHLTWKHCANFAIIIDAIVNIYNQKLEKGQLIEISEFNSVRISNGYLSRMTGLGLNAIKGNLKKIEKEGFIIAINKGQGNTRHYVINIEVLNKYIAALEPEFNDWFKKSKESSKKDKARSEEADSKRIREVFNQINLQYKESKGENLIPVNQLVQNQPTQNDKTSQPEDVKTTVVNTTENTNKKIVKTTTPDDKTENVVVQVFNSEDERGVYYLYEVENFRKKVYLNDYNKYFEKLSDRNIEKLQSDLEELKIGEKFDDNSYDNIEFINDYSKKESEENQKAKEKNQAARLKATPEYCIMITIYNKIKSLKRKILKKEKRKYETTKEAASQEISEINWKKFKQAYDALPNIKNQGKFYTPKEDLINFNTLSKHRQEYVISKVTAMKKSNKTASRPAIYIEEAMLDKLPTIKNTNERINVMI
jgi:hypothetical protein